MKLERLPEPLARPTQTFSGQTVEVLRDMVLSGRLRAGERLNEVELSTALGISRGPLREAIQHLRSEGLLVTVANRGAYVRTLSKAELTELYEVRIALETHALRLAGKVAKPQDLEDLRGMLEETEHAMEGSQPYPRAFDFHSRIVELAGNEAMANAAVEVLRQISLARSRSGNEPDRASEALREHISVVDNLAKGNVEAATRVMTKHLRASLASVLSILGSDEDATGRAVPAEVL